MEADKRQPQPQSEPQRPPQPLRPRSHRRSSRSRSRSTRSSPNSSSHRSSSSSNSSSKHKASTNLFGGHPDPDLDCAALAGLLKSETLDVPVLAVLEPDGSYEVVCRVNGLLTKLIRDENAKEYLGLYEGRRDLDAVSSLLRILSIDPSLDQASKWLLEGNDRHKEVKALLQELIRRALINLLDESAQGRIVAAYAEAKKLRVEAVEVIFAAIFPSPLESIVAPSHEETQDAIVEFASDVLVKWLINGDEKAQGVLIGNPQGLLHRPDLKVAPLVGLWERILTAAASKIWETPEKVEGLLDALYNDWIVTSGRQSKDVLEIRHLHVVAILLGIVKATSPYKVQLLLKTYRGPNSSVKPLFNRVAAVEALLQELIRRKVTALLNEETQREISESYAEAQKAADERLQAAAGGLSLLHDRTNASAHQLVWWLRQSHEENKTAGALLGYSRGPLQESLTVTNAELKAWRFSR